MIHGTTRATHRTRKAASDAVELKSIYWFISCMIWSSYFLTESLYLWAQVIELNANENDRFIDNDTLYCALTRVLRICGNSVRGWESLHADVFEHTFRYRSSCPYIERPLYYEYQIVTTLEEESSSVRSLFYAMRDLREFRSFCRILLPMIL